ncbi:MAG TPA: GNAT family N-acetyltransferase [Acidimicrobiales bacterium]|nr:GNAT family N-acetyltransferase [Acidimicrobiales bacterium]
MNIRTAGVDDAESVLSFFQQYAEPSLTDTPEAVALLLAHPTANVLVAEDSNALVGTLVVAWDGWRGNLYHLAVATERRREGIASRLVTAGLEWLRERGAQRVSALVVEDHDYAVATWEASGFQRTDGLGRWFKMLS